MKLFHLDVHVVNGPFKHENIIILLQLLKFKPKLASRADKSFIARLTHNIQHGFDIGYNGMFTGTTSITYKYKYYRINSNDVGNVIYLVSSSCMLKYILYCSFFSEGDLLCVIIQLHGSLK